MSKDAKKAQEAGAKYIVEYKELLVPTTSGGDFTLVLKDGYEKVFNPEAFEQHTKDVFKNLAEKHSAMKTLEEKKEVKRLVDYLKVLRFNLDQKDSVSELRKKYLEKYPELADYFKVTVEEPKEEVKKFEPIEFKDKEKTDKPKAKKSNGKGHGGKRVSNKAQAKRIAKQKAHVERIKASKAKAKEDRKLISVIIDGAKQPYVKQSQPKGGSPLKGKKRFNQESKKARLNKLRAEYAAWNEKHMAEVEELRKSQDNGELIMEWPKVPRKFKKRHTQKTKDRFATYGKVSNLPKRSEALRNRGAERTEHYNKLLTTIAERNERLANTQPITHHVNGKSSHSLVCITDGVMVHRVPRQLAELIIERVCTKKGEAIWSYTTKGTWKSARAKGNAGYGFDPIPVEERRAESEARRKEEYERRKELRANRRSRSKYARWDKHPRKKFSPTTKTLKKKGRGAQKGDNFRNDEQA